jgi:hypothetical protein
VIQPAKKGGIIRALQITTAEKGHELLPEAPYLRDTHRTLIQQKPGRENP